jgi:hypothetical protein
MDNQLKLIITSTYIEAPYGLVDTSNRFYTRRVLEDFCKKNLTSFEYIKRIRRFVKDKEYFVHDSDKLIYRIPISYLEKLKQYLTDAFVNYYLEAIPKRNIDKIDFKLNTEYNPRPKQVHPIEYLSTINKSRKGLELQTGCISGDTIINFNRAKKGFKLSIENAYKQHKRKPFISRYWNNKITTYIRSFKEKYIQLNEMLDIIYSGKKEVFKIILENGLFLKATIDHLILTKEGYIPLIDCIDKDVMIDTLLPESTGVKLKKYKDKQINISEHHPYGRKYQLPWKSYRVTEHILIYEAYINNMDLETFLEKIKDKEICKTLKFIDTSVYCIHHIDFNHYNNDVSNLQLMKHSDHIQLHSEYTKYNFNQGVPKYSKAISIEKYGIEDTYDISCKDPYNNFVANGIVIHNSGKTFIAINSIANIQKPTIILASGLMDQWYKELKKYLIIDSSDIYIVQGYPSLKKLFEQDIKPKIIICSIGTMRPYVKKEGNYIDLPPYEEFLKIFNIGVKVLDEAHLNFHAGCLIDLYGSVDVNIYLTATFISANSSVKKIFNNYFPEHIIYDEVEYDKYTDVVFYLYNGTVPEKMCITPRGYNHAKYEDYLLKHDNLLLDWLDRILTPLLNMHYFNKGYVGKKKALIFCYRADMVEMVARFIHDRNPNCKVSKYLAEDSDDVLTDFDIIVSTHKGAGTGKDISDLALVINTISYRAPTTSKQVIGRLRKPKDGTQTEYVDMCNINLKSHIRHFRDRRDIIRGCCKSYKEYRL